MNIKESRSILLKAGVMAGLAVSLSGCTSTEMKGTPFYTGECDKRVGSAENRVNLWPLLYYREPALSVAWPLVELTDDHFAIRPVMSVYGLDDTDRAYNVFWPLAHIDCKNGKGRLFPLLWGEGFFAAFPLYWHLKHPLDDKEGYDGLFPLWSLSVDRSGYSFYFLSFLGHAKDNETGEGWHLFPLAGNYSHGGDYYRFMLWPLAHQWRGEGGEGCGDAVLPLYLRYSDAENDLFLTPAYARWRREAGKITSMVPAALSWVTRGELRSDLWMAGGLAHFSWGEEPGSRHIFPLFYSDNEALYTPLFGWNDDSLYLATPLAGVRKGRHSGGWLFPLFSHDRENVTGNVNGSFLWGDYWREGGKIGSKLFPLYDYRDDGEPGKDLAKASGDYGKTFEPLLLFWYRNTVNIRQSEKGQAVVTGLQSNGAFPLWAYTRRTEVNERKETVDGQLLLALYDYVRRRGPAKGGGVATDEYVRARVLWRMWHYERSNGDVSVDIFPAISYDRKGGNFKKISILWRLFRYERNGGDVKLDIAFLPVKR